MKVSFNIRDHTIMLGEMSLMSNFFDSTAERPI